MKIKKNIRWHQAIDKIWKLNRVHVGKETSLGYNLLKKIYKNIKIISFASGNKINGWEIPKGWDVLHAKLKHNSGKIIADWSNNKLSLWSFSNSFKGIVSKKKLLSHLFFDKNRPTATLFHFRNQYNFWKRDWGFSIPYNKFKKLKSNRFKVDIKTRFYDYKLQMAEQIHKGKLKDSILFLGHFDHPQMCIDGLSGCVLGHEIISNIRKKTKLTYRMLSTIEIVGSVFYNQKFSKRNNIKEGLFIATPGAKMKLDYQNSFEEKSNIDRYSKHLIRFYDNKSKIYPFRKGPIGNDEIAFDFGANNIPCGSIMRAPFKEYHTDYDTPKAIDEKNFYQTKKFIEDIIYIFENNSVIKGKFKSIPKLSSKKYKLYLDPSLISGVKASLNKDLGNKIFQNIDLSIKKNLIKNNCDFNYLMNVISPMATGNYTVLDIAEKTNLPFKLVYNYLKLWEEKGLIKLVWKNPFKNK